MDDLKSLAFDHVDHEDVDSFLGHVRSLVDQRLGWKLKRIIEEIRRLEIIQTGSQNDMVDGDSSLLDEYRIMFNEFFGFWRQAVVNLSEQDEFTFEDQKYFAHRHLLERTRKSHERVDHVIVDEFQDINPLDLKLLRTIGDHYEATITIVGDDDQAIYEWRGSTPEYILDPEKYFSRNFQTYTLSTNYRSPKNIVLDSQRLIKHNRRRVNKEIIPNLSETADYIIQTPPDIKSALDLVNRFVEETVRDKFNPGTIGMIYRKRSQMIPYQVRFATSHIRYSADRDLHLFLSKAFDSLLVMLQIKQRIADGYTPSAVVPDFLCLCDQIRDYQLIKEERRNLENHLQEANPATLDSACQALLNFRQPLFKTKNDYGEASSKCDTIIRDFIRSRSVSEALAVLGDKFRGFQKNFMKSEEDIWYRDPPFTQLAEFAESYRDDYGAFISDIQLAKKHLEENPPYNDDDDSQSGLQHAKTSPLLLLTAHRAKGREFDTVIIVDANEEIWPGKKVETDDQHEEARRLFYVAFTRARKRLLILVSKTIGSEVARPSRYLKELGLEGF